MVVPYAAAVITTRVGTSRLHNNLIGHAIRIHQHPSMIPKTIIHKVNTRLFVRRFKPSERCFKNKIRSRQVQSEEKNDGTNYSVLPARSLAHHVPPELRLNSDDRSGIVLETRSLELRDHLTLLEPPQVAALVLRGARAHVHRDVTELLAALDPNQGGLGGLGVRAQDVRRPADVR